MRSIALGPRVFGAVLVTWPVADVGFNIAFVSLQAARGNGCDTSGRLLPTFPYQLCEGTTKERGLDVIVILCVMAALVAFVLLATWWALLPLTRVTDAVSSLGPGSAGLRLAPEGWPRDAATRLARAIDTMLDRFHHGYEAQRRFAANASHELRTPLATQRALIEVGLAAPLSEERSGLLAEQLLAANERNEALVEGLLALAETDQGLVENALLRLDLIVEAVVDDYRESAESRGLTLSSEVETVTVVGEEPLLERLLSNLVENALKYNEAEGWVSVHLRGPATLTVTNTGPVLEPGQTGALFEPFRRVRGERLNHSSGAGLGLTIVRSIATAHHGTVSAKARPNGGLVVEVTLPPAP